MKNSSVTFFIVLFTVVGFVSCDPANTYKKEISSIDSCLTIVDSLQTVFDGIEFDSLALMYENTADNERVIKKYYIADTVNRSLASKLNEAKSVRKSFQSLPDDKKKMEDELLLATTQLANLKTDITNGVLNKDQIEQYLNQEKKALNELYLTIIGFDKMQRTQKARYYYCADDIQAFANQLIEENSVEE